MRFITALAMLSIAGTVSAQTTVMVGAEANSTGGIFQFMPPNITASNGTVVTFVWTGTPGNHTVAQSTLESPCQPMPGGFDSGYIFIPANMTSDFPSWNLTITNDQTPLYFYCAQLAPGPHCSMGMVGTINAPPGGFEAFQAAANATFPMLSGNPSPNLVGVGASASAPPGPLTASGVSGFSVPSAGSAPAPGSSSGSSTSAPSSASSTNAATSSTSAPAANTSASAASLTAANGLVVFLASLFGVVLL